MLYVFILHYCTRRDYKHSLASLLTYFPNDFFLYSCANDALFLVKTVHCVVPLNDSLREARLHAGVILQVYFYSSKERDMLRSETTETIWNQ